MVTTGVLPHRVTSQSGWVMESLTLFGPKVIKHSTSRGFEEEERERRREVGIADERESVLSDCTHTPLPPDSEEPAIWMQVDEITDTHMAAPLVLVGVISYTQSHTRTHKSTHAHKHTVGHSSVLLVWG